MILESIEVVKTRAEKKNKATRVLGGVEEVVGSSRDKTIDSDGGWVGGLQREREGRNKRTKKEWNVEKVE